ncbi:MAG: IS66-like element ISSfl3 family transposase [Coriobacteriia bacterium]
MSDEKPTTPSETADEGGLRALVAELRALIATLNALVRELREQLARKDEEIAELKRALLGPKSERRKRKPSSRTKPPLSDEEKARRRAAAEVKRAAERDKRKQELEVQPIEHAAPDVCPTCQGEGPFVALPPDVSEEIEHLTERLVRLQHRLEKKKCACGAIFSAPTPPRVVEGGLYGPGLYAYAVVSKCADALPLNRISKRFARGGVNIARSTLTDLFHRAASLLQPLHARLLELVAASDYVNADETSQPVMDEEHCRRGFIWTFICAGIIAYVFSKDRGGETPQRILTDSTGYLQVDGHTGYNAVCVPEGRDRVGCIAHARRYFHKARDECPAECDIAFDFFRKLYDVEVQAAEADILGTPAHAILRRDKSKPVLDDFKDWLDNQQDRHDPKGPMGKAIGYAIRQWSRLDKFLEDPKLRLDNNISEGALRIIALGRDNFRWVGHDEAGDNLAILQTIVATCVANDVNPQDYIADVLTRMQTHPASQLDALLPMNWAQTVAASA